MTAIVSESRRMKLLKRIRSSIAGRYKQWTFRPYVIERQILGERIQFLVGDLFGESWYGPHHDLSREYEWIKSNGIRPGDVVADCGANHGFSTTLFARWTGPQGKVYAFEPYSHNMTILKKNLQLNGIKNVICHQAAAGAQAGSVAIFAHPNAAVVTNPKEPRRMKQVQVPLVTLDDVVTSKSVDFLKIDVEGFELEVLKGARRIMALAPRLDIELHVAFYKNKESELRELFDLIDMNRYAAHVQVAVDGSIVPFQKDRHTFEVLSKCEVVHLFCC
jgi:FkbM family methyltransferase